MAAHSVAPGFGAGGELIGAEPIIVALGSESTVVILDLTRFLTRFLIPALIPDSSLVVILIVMLIVVLVVSMPGVWEGFGGQIMACHGNRGYWVGCGATVFVGSPSACPW